MILDTDYTSVAQALDAIEQQAGEKSLIVDPNQALADQVKISDYSYDSACKEIGGIESVLTAEQQSEQQKGAIVQSVNVGEKAAQIRQRIGDAELQKKVMVIDREMVDAAKDLGKFVGSAGKGFEQMMQERVSKMKAKKLVLPGLSLQDQMHELQGILDGLDQNAFDAEQLGIIRLEIAGVNSTKGADKPQSDDQLALIASRDKLLLEIGNRLLNTNN